MDRSLTRKESGPEHFERAAIARQNELLEEARDAMTQDGALSRQALWRKQTNYCPDRSRQRYNAGCPADYSRDGARRRHFGPPQQGLRCGRLDVELAVSAYENFLNQVGTTFIE
ncbi:hypothetical protein Nham_3952 [Nitrobacter hamburgensis X14]|uniref:Uncharacterized protein n=1 Tax=Nitrobacter hamburgensis (strain DSM 10229 / NCIMB 13809 / X14) TaxID=323097 RepID=Q1QGL6_NITHX|nr:hypothetical protein Nham_3952 [Nitrobacter hamburgensis X14]